MFLATKPTPSHLVSVLNPHFDISNNWVDKHYMVRDLVPVTRLYIFKYTKFVPSVFPFFRVELSLHRFLYPAHSERNDLG